MVVCFFVIVSILSFAILQQLCDRNLRYFCCLLLATGFAGGTTNHRYMHKIKVFTEKLGEKQLKSKKCALME